MKVMTIGQLLGLTKAEILHIRDQLTGELARLPPHSVEHVEALATLANIDAVLSRPDFANIGLKLPNCTP